MDMYHPIYKCRTYCFVYFLLSAHVSWIRVPIFFIWKHICLNWLTEFCHMVDVSHWGSICFTNMIKNLVFAALMKHLQFLMKTDSRELVSGWSSISWTCSFHISCWFAPLCCRITWIGLIGYPAYNANSRSKRSWWNNSSRGRCYWGLLWGRSVFLVYQTTSFSNKWRFCMSKLICWWITVHFSVAQSCCMSFLTWSS